MSQKKHFFLASSLLFFFFAANSGFSESFRVRKVVPLSLSQNQESVTVGISDALLIKLPEDRTYLSGIEVNIKIPDVVATWHDSVAYTLYNSLSPSPDEKKIDYTGEKIYVNTIPGKFSERIYFPLSKDFAIKGSPYASIIPKMPKVDDCVFLRFQQAMKGVPEELEKAVFEISAKPVLSDKGKLNLSVTPAAREDKKYAVYIDDNLVSNYRDILLKTGEHHLSIISDSYRNEVRTFRIEQARTTNLAISLKGIEPTLKILSPSTAEVFLDDKKVHPNEERVIDSGDHKITFRFGDYELVKTLSAVNGRSYTVNLNIEANITEEQ